MCLDMANKAYEGYLSGSLNPRLIVDTIEYNKEFAREHPDFFEPSGFICFTGEQGAGKTISAVQYIHNLVLKYPRVQIIANCNIKFPDWDGEVIPYEGFAQVNAADNGYLGIILFLDEILAEFNSLESKKIDPSWFQVISQQRKRRLHVVGTAQVFNRIAKAWREQFSACIACRNLFDLVQINYLVERENVQEDESGNVTGYKASDRFIWFRNPELYSFYDTWERVEKKEGVKALCR